MRQVGEKGSPWSHPEPTAALDRPLWCVQVAPMAAAAVRNQGRCAEGWWESAWMGHRAWRAAFWAWPEEEPQKNLRGFTHSTGGLSIHEVWAPVRVQRWAPRSVGQGQPGSVLRALVLLGWDGHLLPVASQTEIPLLLSRGYLLLLTERFGRLF